MLIAGKVAQGTPIAESLREYLALTIAVVGAAEQLYRSVRQPYPEQWESLERSAETFMDHFVEWLPEGDPELKRAVTRHRRRKLAAHRGVLRLVESDRAKRAWWVAVTLPQDAPIPIAEEVGEGLGELTSRPRSVCTSISRPWPPTIRWYSRAKSSGCCARPSAFSRCCRRTRSRRSASDSLLRTPQRMRHRACAASNDCESRGATCRCEAAKAVGSAAFLAGARPDARRADVATPSSELPAVVRAPAQRR